MLASIQLVLLVPWASLHRFSSGFGMHLTLLELPNERHAKTPRRSVRARDFRHEIAISSYVAWPVAAA